MPPMTSFQGSVGWLEIEKSDNKAFSISFSEGLLKEVQTTQTKSLSLTALALAICSPKSVEITIRFCVLYVINECWINFY